MADQDDSSKQTRTKRSLRLPRVGFTEVLPLVQALEDLSGHGSRKLIFGQAKLSANGGAADAKWSALGYYGFRSDKANDDGRFELTERGRALLSRDDATRQEAMQRAIVATGFRSVVERFSTRSANATTLTAVLHDEFGVPESAASKTAAALVTVAQEAGLIVDGVFQAGPIEDAINAVPDSSSAASAAPGAAKPRTAPKRHTDTTRESSFPAAHHRPTTRAETVQVPASGPLALSVEIKIDAEKHTPQEIGQIIREARSALDA